MTTLPSSGYMEDDARTEGEMKQAFEDLRDVIEELVGGGAESELTISSGTVTATGSCHSIDTEGDDSTDDLTNILQTNTPDGRFLFIHPQDSSRTVVVKNAAGGTGQILTADGADVTLDNTNMWMVLKRTSTNWQEVGRFNFSASTTQKGIVELATDAETVAGTDTSRAITPAGLASFIQYDYIWVPAGAMIPCTTNGATASTEEFPTNDIDLDVMVFDSASIEERTQFTVVMPPNWDRSTIKAKFYWTNDLGDSNVSPGDTVEWAIKAGALSDDDSIDTALGTPQVISDAVLADGDLHVTGATPAITVAGTPALGDLVQFEVYRNTDGTDNMAAAAWLIGVLIQYKKNQTVSAW